MVVEQIRPLRCGKRTPTCLLRSANIDGETIFRGCLGFVGEEYVATARAGFVVRCDISYGCVLALEEMADVRCAPTVLEIVLVCFKVEYRRGSTGICPQVALREVNLLGGADAELALKRAGRKV